MQRTLSLTRFYYFLRLSLLLSSLSLSFFFLPFFFSRSRSPLLIAQEQQVRLGGSVGGLSGVVLLRIYPGDGVKPACLLFFQGCLQNVLDVCMRVVQVDILYTI